MWRPEWLSRWLFRWRLWRLRGSVTVFRVCPSCRNQAGVGTTTLPHSSSNSTPAPATKEPECVTSS